MTLGVDGHPHMLAGAWGSHHCLGKKKRELISGASGKQCRPAVVPLTPAVFNPVSYSLPPRHQQLPLDNFHRNDSSPEIIVPHNQTRREAMK